MAMVKMLVLTAVMIFTLMIVEATQPDYCTQPKVVGPCRAAFRRYYFDTSRQECRSFIYGGCQGNLNNFASQSQCRAACDCTQNMDSGTRSRRRQCRRSVQRYYYDVDDATCKRFRYSGCGGNSNRFSNVRGCLDACVTSLCFLPSETGPCRAAFKKYYYNKETQSCETFTYGGCQGNANRFDTEDECNRSCTIPIAGEIMINYRRTPREISSHAAQIRPTSSPQTNICHLPQIIGPCRLAIKRYFHNSTSNSCERFTYGGCQANENNFATEGECQRRCIPNSGNQHPALSSIMAPPQSAQLLRDMETCQLAPDQGPCRKYEQHYYFNGATGKCEELIYGGCQGNKNRFPTVEMCMKLCGQFASQATGPKSSIPGGGLGFKANSVGSAEQYESSIPGGGLASFIGDGVGRSSIPGGGLRTTNVKPTLCRTNIFSAMAEKVRAMFGLPSQTPNSPCTLNYSVRGRPSSSSKDRCFLPAETGLCRAYFPKYHYNATAGICEEFIYGGCGGNENRFDSMADCEKQCGASGPPTPQSQCSLPPESGICLGNFPKYHFNATAGVCEEFIYGGCGGNDNRFDSIEECETKCGATGASAPPPQPSAPIDELCLLPPETGRCRAYFQKYHYNAASGACEQFVYGGCGGNKNRFDTVAECQRKCRGN